MKAIRTKLKINSRPFILLTVLCAIFVGLLWQVWGRSTHPVIDFGRDPYVATSVLEGKTLYKDVIYIFGPVTPFFLAGLIAVFGDSLLMFQLLGVGVAISTLFAIFMLTRLLANDWVAFVAGLMFLFMSSFADATGGPNMNFLTPYSYAATISMSAALWALYCMTKWMENQTSRFYFWESVVLLFVTVFTKQEVGLALLLTSLVVWITYRVNLKCVLGISMAGVALSLFFFYTFGGADPEGHEFFSENLLRYSRNWYDNTFYFSMAGYAQWKINLFRIALFLFQISLIVALCRSFRLIAQVKSRWIAFFVRSVVVCLLLGLIYKTATMEVFRIIPLLCVVFIVFNLVRMRKELLVPVALFTFLCATRILFNFFPLWYGFFLLCPAYIFTCVLFGEKIKKYFNLGGIYVVSLCVVAGGMLLRSEMDMLHNAAVRCQPIHSPKGTVTTHSKLVADACNELVEFTSKLNKVERGSFVILPEAATLHYMTETRNPTSYYHYIKLEMRNEGDELRMLLEMARERPKYILWDRYVARRDHEEVFGRDFGLNIVEWIKKNYVLVSCFPKRTTNRYEPVFLLFKCI